MRIAFTFRDGEASPRVKGYATAKVQRLRKFLHGPLDAEVTVSQERHLHVVHIAVKGDERRFVAEESAETSFAAIDMVLDKVGRQLRSAKDMASKQRQSAPGIKSPHVQRELRKSA